METQNPELEHNNSINPPADQSTPEGEQPLESSTPKTFTQDEVNNIVSKRINQINLKMDKKVSDAVAAALAEHDRQSKLTDEEKAKENLTKQSEDISKRERELTLRERRADALEELARKSIPRAFVDYIVDVDEDKTKANIETLATAWNEALSAAIAAKLAGKTPLDASTPTTKLKAARVNNGTYEHNGVKAF